MDAADRAPSPLAPLTAAADAAERLHALCPAKMAC